MSYYKIHDFHSHQTGGVTINSNLNVTGTSQLETLNVSGNLDVVGNISLNGSNIVNSDGSMEVTGTAQLNALNVSNTSTIGPVVLKGHIIPDTNDAYDIGSAEFKIRDMYVSDNSLWIGDTHKINVSSDGKLKFRKRITNQVPASILAAGGTEAGVKSFTGINNLSNIKLHHWKAYMRTLSGKAGATIQDIFRDNSDDYDQESASDNWLESGTKTYNIQGNVGIGTPDPSALLTLHYEPESSNGLKELLRLSWNDGNYDTLKGDGTKISFQTSNTNNFPGNTEGGYLGVMKSNAVEADTECDFSLGLNNGTSIIERIRVLSNGNVGIGTSSPTYKLDLLGDNLAMLKIKTTDTQAGPHIDLYDLNNNVATIAWIGDGTAGTGARDSALEIRNTGRMNFTTSNNVDDPELTILNNGNVGIGTTNPSNKLYVVGDMVVLNNADLNTAYIMAGSGASNRRSNLSFYSTFYNNGDTGTRRTADIVAGFSSGAWGNEYLSFSVGKGGSPNDGQELTNEVMRITNKVGIGTTNPEFKLHVNISNSTNALGVFCTGNSLNPRHQFASSTTQFAVPSCHQIHIRQYQSYERTRKTGLWLGVYSDENAEVSHQTICFTQYLQFQRTASVNDYGGTLEYVSNTTQGRVNGNNTTKLGYIDQYSGNNRLNFTGQHRCKVEDPIIDIELYEGLIVCANKNKYLKMSDGVNVGLKAITINESLPLVSLSNKEKDKSCFGVISSEEDPEKREDKFGCFVSQHEKEKGDMRVYINSLGEGGIWVSNINGPLESGDYITTSKLPGYGQKQDSEFLANYTVAKITMDCDFEPKMQPVQEILKEIQEKKLWYRIIDLEVEKKEYDESDKEKYEQEGKYYIKKKIYSEIETDVYNLYDVIKEYNNILSDKGELQWIDTEEMEPEYKIRYLDENGEITTEENCVYKAAFVGCTYHCG